MNFVLQAAGMSAGEKVVSAFIIAIALHLLQFAVLAYFGIKQELERQDERIKTLERRAHQ